MQAITKFLIFVFLLVAGAGQYHKFWGDPTVSTQLLVNAAHIACVALIWESSVRLFIWSGRRALSRAEWSVWALAIVCATYAFAAILVFWWPSPSENWKGLVFLFAVLVLLARWSIGILFYRAGETHRPTSTR